MIIIMKKGQNSMEKGVKVIRNKGGQIGGGHAFLSQATIERLIYVIPFGLQNQRESRHRNLYKVIRHRFM